MNYEVKNQVNIINVNNIPLRIRIYENWTKTEEVFKNATIKIHMMIITVED